MKTINHEQGRLTLSQGFLNDDEAIILEKGYKFTGHNGATVVIVYYTFATEWSNHEHYKFFKSLENAMAWYKRQFRDRAIYQGRVWLTEGCPDEYPEKDRDGIIITTDDDALTEFDNLTINCEII